MNLPFLLHHLQLVICANCYKIVSKVIILVFFIFPCSVHTFLPGATDCRESAPFVIYTSLIKILVTGLYYILYILEPNLKTL